MRGGGVAASHGAVRALVVTRYGGPEVLKVEERPDVKVGADEVAVEVAFAGLNFAEVSARVGLYPDAPKPPMVVGYEFAGTVSETGSGVTGFARGERVVGMIPFGAHASRVVAKPFQLRKVPEALSLEQAAAMPVNYLTAFHMLFHVGNLKPKQKVLVHMAAGGGGLAVIELAREVPGVELFGTASASKHERLKQAGLHHPIDYHSLDYSAEVRRLNGGRGVDLVLDALGTDDWRKGYALLNPAGHLICFGMANVVSGERRNLLKVGLGMLKVPRFWAYEMMGANKSVSGVHMGHLWSEVELMGSHLDRLMALAAEGKVKPHVDRVFPLAQGGDAHRYIQSRQNFGKVLLDCRA